LVKNGRLGFAFHARDEVRVLRMALNESGYHTAADAQAAIQATISNPTNADYYGLNGWDNYYVGGQFREEDSPGNYVLCETNNLLKLIPIDPTGMEDERDALDLPLKN